MKSITTISLIPKELEEKLVDWWKFDLLGIRPERLNPRDANCVCDSPNPEYKENQGGIQK